MLDCRIDEKDESASASTSAFARECAIPTGTLLDRQRPPPDRTSPTSSRSIRRRVRRPRYGGRTALGQAGGLSLPAVSRSAASTPPPDKANDSSGACAPIFWAALAARTLRAGPAHASTGGRAMISRKRCGAGAGHDSVVRCGGRRGGDGPMSFIGRRSVAARSFAAGIAWCWRCAREPGTVRDHGAQLGNPAFLGSIIMATDQLRLISCARYVAARRRRTSGGIPMGHRSVGHAQGRGGGGLGAGVATRPWSR